MGIRLSLKRALPLAMVALGAFLFTACSGKATQAECEKACDNIRHLALSTADSELSRGDAASLGETERELAEETAALFGEFLAESCVKRCVVHSTSSVARCLAQVKSREQLSRCYQ